MLFFKGKRNPCCYDRSSTELSFRTFIDIKWVTYSEDQKRLKKSIEYIVCSSGSRAGSNGMCVFENKTLTTVSNP